MNSKKEKQPRVFTILPEDTTPLKYSLRGIIKKFGIREHGWWIFKDDITFIGVEFDDFSLKEFKQSLLEDIAYYVQEHEKSLNIPELESVIDIDLSEDIYADRYKEKIGKEIQLTFICTLNKIFFSGLQAMMVLTKVEVFDPVSKK